MIFLYLLSSYFSSRAIAAPIQNATANVSNSTSNSTSKATTVGWVEAPNARGTFDLLISCLTTLSLCAWTAYHPNVRVGASYFSQFRHRTAWMIIAILFPELVLYCAWQQWWTSRQFRDEINALGDSSYDEELASSVDNHPLDSDNCLCEPKEISQNTDARASSVYNLDILFGDEEASISSHEGQISVQMPTEEPRIESEPRGPSSESQRSLSEPRVSTSSTTVSEKSTKTSSSAVRKTPEWTMEQAFFAVSGGFAVDLSGFSPHRRVALTLHGLKFLASLGLLPLETPETVADKSKADSVAKILVCLQAAWFFVQCIARVAAKLPVTLLELHVLIHVLCAFAMYLIWISKPYDVGSPILCTNEKVVDLAALFALHVDWEGTRGVVTKATSKCCQTSTITLSEVHTSHKALPPRSSTRKYLDKLLKYLYQNEVPEYWERNRHKLHAGRPADPPETPQTLEHHQRANRALEYLKSRNHHLGFLSYARPYNATPSSTDSEELEIEYVNEAAAWFPHTYLVPTCSNLFIDGFSLPDLGDSKEDPARQKLLIKQLKVLAVMSTLYGSLHLLAWSFHFSSPVEMWFWRSSALAMVAGPVSTMFLAGCIFMEDCIRPEESEKNTRWWVKVKKQIREVVLMVTFQVLMLVVCVAWAVYPVGRCFVLVESFVSLRKSEKRIYETVEWTNFFPHAG
ncbi:hypothetical protein GQ43DRAFT_438217 [Delitschia confertaspora ATCC 74209]|uniref:Uncharacterized protein n=1 Tax=Delitschia confertaspora ATCC 74209 TaxID=1513339 RepID=A0A9P4N1T1_9PLEO|nr:hypothetical protein GQ43DRAFT_438217 [Delitschia confertaspora ATCC 74209]